MPSYDVIIVGAGPAGSSCAWSLCRQGVDVLVLDKATFPRDKVCAGWITPAVLAALAVEPEEYGREQVLQPFTGFRVGLLGRPAVCTEYGRPVSFGIRRCELDHYLLQRCGARLQLGQPLKSLSRNQDGWQVNDDLRAPLLIGAGGHFCPVARQLDVGSDHGRPVIAAQEIELRLSDTQKAQCAVEPQIPEIYFCSDLKGYGWCVRKGDYLNIGLGREDRQHLARHVADFVAQMQEGRRIPLDVPKRFPGHAYLLYNRGTRWLSDDGVLCLGDAAGLAYAQSGEGIRPAVESGILAAETIVAATGSYGRERLQAYDRRIAKRFGKLRAPRPGRTWLPSGLAQSVARRLLANRWFVRHVVLDRWFLHAQQPPLPAPNGAFQAGQTSV